MFYINKYKKKTVALPSSSLSAAFSTSAAWAPPSPSLFAALSRSATSALPSVNNNFRYICKLYVL